MRLLGSLSFRLALVYVGLFSASVAVLGGLYYWVAIAAPIGEVRDELAVEGRELAGLYHQHGAERLADRLEERAGAPSPRLAYHALLRPDGSIVTANLPSWPTRFTGSWHRIEADISREGDEDEHEPLVLDQRFEDGARLMIGRDIDDLDDLEEELTEALVWLLPALALLGIFGAALMSLAIGRRLEAMSSTARRVIAGDLTERIELRGTGDDFDRLGETFNLMLSRIEESIEAVRRVSDNVAHELRTPLARLQAGLLELQSETGTDDRILNEVIAEADRLQSTFEAVLRIARVESSLPARDFAAVDVATLLLDAVDYYQPEAEARSQRLCSDARPPLLVLGDRDLLFQAFVNLIDNAIKYTPAGGRIEVAVGREGGDILLTVIDDGPGVPPESLSKLGQRFFRAPAAEETPGLGLGLAFVSAVAALHESKLEFRSDSRGLTVNWRMSSLGDSGDARRAKSA